jgi:magnesium-protoporphyrin O-methyltransferase
MPCSHCEEADTFFDRSTAEDELRSFRRDGPPNASTRLLIDGLKTLDLDGKTLLDVGGGVGMIQHELLDEGLSSATMVETSTPYLDVAEAESRRRGHGARTTFRRGDVVELAPELPEADLVTLDRVFCCYPHLKKMVRATAAKASRWYAVSYPREHWFNHVVGTFADLYCWGRGSDFRLYIHTGVDEAIQDEGFSRFYRVTTLLWTVAFYERAPAGD